MGRRSRRPTLRFGQIGRPAGAVRAAALGGAQRSAALQGSTRAASIALSREVAALGKLGSRSVIARCRPAHHVPGGSRPGQPGRIGPNWARQPLELRELSARGLYDGCVLRARTLICAGALLAAGGAAAGDAGAGAAHAQVGAVRILGFTTAPWVGGVAPQVGPGRKITTCLDAGQQRQIAVIFRTSGFPKTARVGVAVWGGNSGFQGTFEPKPAVAAVAHSARPWASAAAAGGAASGISYAAGPDGPTNIDGVWNAFVVVDGKLRASAQVTVACSA